jgi:predicted HTH transcriptional regulator
MLALESKVDLQRLIDDEIQESLILEFKASASLSRESKARDELCKDVSAFANSAGGQIVYGVVEERHKPLMLDDGADPVITKEWVEQVISSRVQPRIEGLRVVPIELAAGRLGFVINVPHATSRAPHQAPDFKYYRRYNFQSAPMADHEIRDILRRASVAEPFISFTFQGIREAG